MLLIVNYYKKRQQQQNYKREQTVKSQVNFTRRIMPKRPLPLPTTQTQSVTSREKQNQQTLPESAIKQQSQQSQQLHIDLTDFTQLNNSGYYVNYNNLIGQGRYGQVYQGYSSKHNLKMAVKKIPQSTQNGTNIADQTKKQIDVLQQICSQKSYHKNVLKYYHYEEYENFFYVFTQFCQKGSLKQYVARRNYQLSQKEYFRILKSIVQGMIFINKKFIIHRDIKPANILVDENNDIKIGDFGISREIPLGDEAPTKNMCTPHYGAPQILRESQFYTENIDVWSCGVMMYQLIEKKSIYQKYRPKTVNQLIKALKLFQQQQDFVQFSNPYISQKFQKIIKKMLTIQPSKRPAFQEIQKYIEYEQLVRFYHLYESPQQPEKNDAVDKDNSRILQQYNQHQKQKYLTILKRYLKYRREKICILLALQKKFMNRPFQVLWNVQKYILKYLTLNMFLIRAQQYSNWLHVSLNDSIINLQQELKINISQYRYNYRMIAQLLRQQKKKIDSDIRKYYKSITIHAQKIEIDYFNREKEMQRIRSYMDVRLIENLFAYTRKNSFAEFDTYHQIFKSLIQLKQYYLTYQHVQALPTFQDKEIYFYILLIYHFDKFFNEKKYVRELLQMDEITNTQKDKKVVTGENGSNNNNNNNNTKKDDGFFTYTRPLQQSITGVLTEHVSDFKQRMQDQKEMMKWIRRHNLSRLQVFGKGNDQDKSSLFNSHNFNLNYNNQVEQQPQRQPDNNNQKIQSHSNTNSNKLSFSKRSRKQSSNSSDHKSSIQHKQIHHSNEQHEQDMQVLPSQQRRFIKD